MTEQIKEYGFVYNMPDKYLTIAELDRVQWHYKRKHSFPFRFMILLMDMDKAKRFERHLKEILSYSEGYFEGSRLPFYNVSLTRGGVTYVVLGHYQDSKNIIMTPMEHILDFRNMCLIQTETPNNNGTPDSRN